MVEQDVELNLDFKKIKLSYVLLGVFLILGFYLRAYHIDFPSIGYHNMKENEYLAETMFFNEQGDLLHRRTYNFYGMEDGPGYFEEYAQPPLVPYLTLPFWKVFGEQIWIPRAIIILFSLASIILTYLVVKQLTKNEYLSLLSSFLFAIMPLGTYFGRNIQPEMPALFCTLISLYFYIKWTDSFNKKHLMYAMIGLAFAGLFKLTFLIFVIPLLFITPFKKLLVWLKNDKKELIGQIKYAVYGILPLVVIQGISELTIVDPSKKDFGSLKEILNVFDASYWARTLPSLSAYISDNYTWWFFWFAVAGLILISMKYRTKLAKLMIGYVAAIAAYILLLSGKIGGHSYYQMPFLPFFVIASAFFIYSIGTIIKQIIKIPHIEYAPLLLLLLTITPVQEANDRVWGTIFYGQDVVGEYIKLHTAPNERFFNFGHSQTQAVCTYAKRRCGGDFANLTKFMELEKKFGIRYMNLDAYSYQILQQEENKESFAYIQRNYKIKLVGALPANNQLSIVNILLERGGTYNLAEIQTKQPILAKTYKTKQGDVPFYVIEND